MLTLQSQQPVNYKALSWTAGVHLLLLLFFFLWKFAVPTPPVPVQELGMEVNLGTSDNGSGKDQPMDIDEPAASAATNARHSSSAASSAQQDVVRSNDNDAPDVPKTNIAVAGRNNNATQEQRNKRSNQQTATTTTAPQQVQKPRFVYAGSNGRGGNGAQTNAQGGNEGNTTGPGDRGVPHGTPGATNYTGSPGSGTGGISHSLENRVIVGYPAKEAEFREGGKVVVRVTVNRDGTIVNQQILSATNPELRPIVLRKLQQVKFNKSPDAREEQFGNITFVFKTRS